MLQLALQKQQRHAIKQIPLTTAASEQIGKAMALLVNGSPLMHWYIAPEKASHSLSNLGLHVPNLTLNPGELLHKK